MFPKLVSHNEDIGRLVEKGYVVGYDSNYLIIRQIPYLNQALKLERAAIVTKVKFINEEKVVQEDHQIFFSGGVPYNIDGTPIPNLGGGPAELALSKDSSDIVVQRSFSNKPKINGNWADFKDFFEKIESYVTIISGPAMELYQVTPFDIQEVADFVSDPIFKFPDTLTSRAQITDLAAKLEEDVIAIIGLGGTGAYLLDFLVKTRVKEIRAFDMDPFYVHNAYRSPGRVDSNEFERSKAEVYRTRYENFRHGLSIIPKFIDESCQEDLRGVTFAFVCVDKGSSRGKIFDLLISQGIPFIDVGMGLNRKRGSLTGMMSTVYYSVDNAAKLREHGLAELTDAPNDEYRTNIQISELNALNAAHAVIKYKQIRGYYLDETQDYNLCFDISDGKTVGESEIDEV